MEKEGGPTNGSDPDTAARRRPVAENQVTPSDERVQVDSTLQLRQATADTHVLMSRNVVGLSSYFHLETPFKHPNFSGGPGFVNLWSVDPDGSSGGNFLISRYHFLFACHGRVIVSHSVGTQREPLSLGILQ